MKTVFSADISDWNKPVGDSYPYPWLIFRLGDGNLVDAHAKANLAWARQAYASGRLLGYTGYWVYRVGRTPDTVLAATGYPRDRHVMVDVESWRKQIVGDHSGPINSIVASLRKRQADSRLVSVYGNSPDLAEIYPRRTSDLRIVAAGWGTKRPAAATMGWQYSNGQSIYPVAAGFPRSCPPFGPVDHDQLYLIEGVDFNVASNPRTYTVQASDSDGLIALCGRLGITDWQAVAKLNNLVPPYPLTVGQVLLLVADPTPPAPKQPPTPPARVYQLGGTVGVHDSWLSPQQLAHADGWPAARHIRTRASGPSILSEAQAPCWADVRVTLQVAAGTPNVPVQARFCDVDGATFAIGGWAPDIVEAVTGPGQSWIRCEWRGYLPPTRRLRLAVSPASPITVDRVETDITYWSAK